MVISWAGAARRAKLDPTVRFAYKGCVASFIFSPDIVVEKVFPAVEQVIKFFKELDPKRKVDVLK